MCNIQTGMYVIVRYGPYKGVEGQVVRSTTPHYIWIKRLFTKVEKILVVDQLYIRKHPDTEDVIQARQVLSALEEV